MRLFRQAAPGWRDLGFFAMALMIHSVLMLLPIKAWQTHKPASERLNSSEPLIVHLQAAPETISEANEPAPKPQAQIEEPVLPHLEKKPAADYTLAEIPPSSNSVVPNDQQVSEPESSQILSTHQLRQWAEQADELISSHQTNRTLGTARSYLPPANWNQNAGAAFSSSFDDRSHEVTLPAKATVVDRWQAADGSHEVLVQLPNGESLCGRAAAYNPMQPLVEPIMMFRSCGSTPTFTMPERYKKGR